MKLNLVKCIFGVSSGKFLGFMVSQRGIEANPEKVRAILDMVSPKTVKEVQRLTGRVAALNRYVSKATDKCLPFFKVLKQDFQWKDECEAAFQNLKQYLAKPPLLSLLVEGEDLFLYLVVSQTTVSSALIREESKIQWLVYYTSQAFQGVKAKYPRMEKMAFSLIVAQRKLRPYFQAHTIIIMTDQPIQNAIGKPDAVGRMVQWAVELSQFDIEYRLRTAQALADFIVEFTLPDLDQGIEYQTIYTDGLSITGLRGVGIIMTSPEKDVLK